MIHQYRENLLYLQTIDSRVNMKSNKCMHKRTNLSGSCIKKFRTIALKFRKTIQEKITKPKSQVGVQRK